MSDPSSTTTNAERILVLLARAQLAGETTEAGVLYATFYDEFDSDPDTLRLIRAGILDIKDASGHVFTWRDPDGAERALARHDSIVYIGDAE